MTNEQAREEIAKWRKEWAGQWTQLPVHYTRGRRRKIYKGFVIAASNVSDRWFVIGDNTKRYSVSREQIMECNQ